jgi:hypothetical protein
VSDRKSLSHQLFEEPSKWRILLGKKIKFFIYADVHGAKGQGRVFSLLAVGNPPYLLDSAWLSGETDIKTSYSSWKGSRIVSRLERFRARWLPPVRRVFIDGSTPEEATRNAVVNLAEEFGTTLYRFTNLSNTWTVELTSGLKITVHAHAHYTTRRRHDFIAHTLGSPPGMLDVARFPKRHVRSVTPAKANPANPHQLS